MKNPINVLNLSFYLFLSLFHCFTHVSFYNINCVVVLSYLSIMIWKSMYIFIINNVKREGIWCFDTLFIVFSRQLVCFIVMLLFITHVQNLKFWKYRKNQSYQNLLILKRICQNSYLQLFNSMIFIYEPIILFTVHQCHLYLI